MSLNKWLGLSSSGWVLVDTSTSKYIMLQNMMLNLYVLWMCSFYTEANETVAALHPIRCLKEREMDLGLDWTKGMAGIIVVAVVIWMLLRRRRVKPKIN